VVFLGERSLVGECISSSKIHVKIVMPEADHYVEVAAENASLCDDMWRHIECESYHKSQADTPLLHVEMNK
jgi:hypothetical protein